MFIVFLKLYTDLLVAFGFGINLSNCYVSAFENALS